MGALHCCSSQLGYRRIKIPSSSFSGIPIEATRDIKSILDIPNRYVFENGEWPVRR